MMTPRAPPSFSLRGPLNQIVPHPNRGAKEIKFLHCTVLSSVDVLFRREYIPRDPGPDTWQAGFEIKYVFYLRNEEL